MPKPTFHKLTMDKQKQIVDAAVDEFSECSFNEVKIASIIKKAKIPRSSFYDYFEDKTDIFRYVIGVIGEEKKKYFMDVLEPDEENFFDYLRSVLHAGAKFAASKPEYDRIGKRMYKDFELMKEIFNVEIDDIPNKFEAIIVKGIENATIRKNVNIEFISKVLTILSAQIVADTTKESDLDLSEIISNNIDDMIDFIKFGIGK